MAPDLAVAVGPSQMLPAILRPRLAGHKKQPSTQITTRAMPWGTQTSHWRFPKWKSLSLGQGKVRKAPKGSRAQRTEHAGEGTALFEVPNGGIGAGDTNFAARAGGEGLDLSADAAGSGPGRDGGMKEPEELVRATDVHRRVSVRETHIRHITSQKLSESLPSFHFWGCALASQL